MPVSVIWDNDEKTILRFEVNGDWEIDETWERITIDGLRLTREADTVPDAIIDMRGQSGNGLPQGFMTQGRSFSNWIERQNLGSAVMVLVGAGRMMQAGADILRKLNIPMSTRSFFADNLDDARAHIAAYRADHPREKLPK